MRHLPRHYPGDSVYALFPFFTPAVMRDNLQRLGTEGQYSGLDGRRPAPAPVPAVVDTIAGIDFVMRDPATFGTTYARDMKRLTQGYGFVLVFDETEQ